ncbi:cytotoxic translational repressor of toxin-antitoxin stability system [Arthrobacter psychrochitiniphilus]|uniref:Cytotoxic translational repressor of toxin-antitoxin stability system n=1 Tax=Arthrobacter psychrochitiniphilus TaxID=291045 RepID=A0A2V3DRB8_9MICC|nr:cytotoxic translational repressor of toxin-antitoxin stability system [Arthrobacter psychrochitiniphilus]
MSVRRLGGRDDHEKFCVTEKWELVVNARGKPVRHHTTYRLALKDGRILRTRISRPVDRTTYSASIWNHVLQDQLTVEDDLFWACVEDGVLPARGTASVPESAIPLALVWQLTRTAGIDEAVVARMTKEQAVQAINDYWMSQGNQTGD